MTSSTAPKAVEAKSSAPQAKKEDPKPPFHPVFDLLQTRTEDDPDLIRPYFDDPKDPISSNPNLEDENGMTALMTASWKGKARCIKFLIQQGCDVNGGNHEHDYKCLHFAALAGKPEACKVLVENGAKIDAINSVKRTATQMAAFVGNHAAVSVINNFVPKESVYYYARKQPLEEKAKLPLEMAKPLYNLVMSMNTHPVRIALIIKDSEPLLNDLATTVKILELMSDREFKNTREVNEVLSLKYHMIHYIVKDIMKEKEKYDKKDEAEKKTPFIDLWIKSMLIGRNPDGFTAFQENFLRQGIKEFPYKEATLFKALVANFSHCQNPGESVPAAEYINQSFNGQKGFKDCENCSTCGNEEAPKKCSKCKSVQYCDQACQKYHWFMHKKFCAALKAQYEKCQAANSTSQGQAATIKPEE